MLKDITLGQYFPGDTPVHRLDPRTKILLLIAFIVALFSAAGWASYGLVLAVTVRFHISASSATSSMRSWTAIWPASTTARAAISSSP